jgi:pseudouridine-5'-monophosphatase
MDGLLINSEDIITDSINQVLAKYGRPAITGSIRAQIMGVPDSTNNDIFHNWAQLPIPREKFAHEYKEEIYRNFHNCKPMPGSEKLLSALSRARNVDGEPILLGLASSTKTESYELKVTQPETKRLLDFIHPDRRILGGDSRLCHGRGKPAPDTYMLALQVLNSGSQKPIMPNECLVFEDSVTGFEAGRRAGMRVIWVPHPDVAIEYDSRKEDILAGRCGTSNLGEERQLGEVNDGWAECISSLEAFDCEKYGIYIG